MIRGPPPRPSQLYISIMQLYVYRYVFLNLFVFLIHCFYSSEIRECLKLDPEHRDCFPHYKKVKKLAKQINSIHDLIEAQQWDDCIAKVDSMLNTEPNVFSFVHKANSHKCHCYAKVMTEPNVFSFVHKANSHKCHCYAKVMIMLPMTTILRSEIILHS